MYSYLIGKVGAEMKHIQKDFTVKMYIPRESANQNVAIVGERSDEDEAVPSVMRLIEKLTDEEVDEMIPETDVDDIQCSEQIVDVPVPQIADRIVEVVAALHGSESQNESLHRSLTYTKWWRRSSKILDLTQKSGEHTDAKVVLRHDPAVDW